MMQTFFIRTVGHLCFFKLYSNQVTNFYKVTQLEDPKLEEYYERAMKELNEFFGIRWVRNRPGVYLVDDRDTINSIRGAKTEDWVVGWINGGEMAFVLNKDKFENNTNHKYNDDDYFKLIKHELAHLFFKIAAGGKTGPKWLWEGVSILVSGQAEQWGKPKEFKGFLEGNDVYKESGYALLLLVNKYGKDKLIEFLKTRKNFNGDLSILFKETYGLELSYATFNDLLTS